MAGGQVAEDIGAGLPSPPPPHLDFRTIDEGGLVKSFQGGNILHAVIGALLIQLDSISRFFFKSGFNKCGAMVGL
jgi:hypothetical protein